jgi:hypothetical protein
VVFDGHAPGNVWSLFPEYGLLDVH